VNGYTVTHVRMESSDEGGRHEHIEGVCTSSGRHYARAEVVESLRAANVWRTHADDDYALIREISFCKHVGCMATPYITTVADVTAANHLDNLPRC
jgi:hypothetical protein